MIASPESLKNRLSPESDIWALGALASELLVWSFAGWTGVQNYFNLRGAETVQALKETHHACFHDGVRRLPIIDDYHRELLKNKQVEDDISRLASQMILEHMLVEHPSTSDQEISQNLQSRRSAADTYRWWQKEFRTIFSPDVSSIRNIGPQHSASEPQPMNTQTESYLQAFEVVSQGPTTIE